MLLLDHIVFLVEDLEIAIKDFQKAGYIVSKGGKHDNKITENALIHFENGTFLELLALQNTWKSQLLKWILGIFLHKSDFRTPSPISDVRARFASRALSNASGRVIDFCLLAEDGLTDYEVIKKQNLPISPIVEMKRVRPDGQTLKWNIFAPHEGALPFVMTPYEPLFKPKPENLLHSNGAKGFETVRVYTDNFEAIVHQYEQFLGIAPLEKTATYAIFQLGRGSIEVLDNHTQSKIDFLEVIPPIILSYERND